MGVGEGKRRGEITNPLGRQVNLAWLQDKQVKQHYYDRNYHTLVVCYHAHWAIAYLACLPIWVLL